VAVLRQDHVKKDMLGEGLREAGLNGAFDVAMLIPHSDKRPGDLFTRLEAPTRSNPIPRNTTMDPVFTRRCAAAACGGEAWRIRYIC
jgi:hypothetical protein